LLEQFPYFVRAKQIANSFKEDSEK
jgi:hypothetical protein